MGVGAVEMPTGTLDHDFGEGAFASIVAGLLSVEKGKFSAIGYGFYRRPGAYESVREGGNVFLGGGLAWTPIDDEGRLASFQVGLSHETTLMPKRVTCANSIRVVRVSSCLPPCWYRHSQSLLFFGPNDVAASPTLG